MVCVFSGLSDPSNAMSSHLIVPIASHLQANLLACTAKKLSNGRLQACHFYPVLHFHSWHKVGPLPRLLYTPE